MTDESQTVGRVIDALVERGLISDDDEFLARIVANATVAALREDGQLRQLCLPTPGDRGGVWL